MNSKRRYSSAEETILFEQQIDRGGEYNTPNTQNALINFLSAIAVIF